MPESPEGLLLDERTDAAQFRMLGLKTLAEQALERAAILQGLCRLAGTEDAKLHPTASTGSAQMAQLRRLMVRLLHRHSRYQALAEHNEYGPIYAALGDMTKASCAQLAKYIGTMPLHNGRK